VYGCGAGGFPPGYGFGGGMPPYIIYPKVITPGKDDKKITPGTDDKKITPGKDDKKITPGTDDKKITPGTDDKKITPGKDDKKITPGTDDKKITPGTDDKKITPGTDDKKITPGTDDKKITPGTDDKKITPDKSAKIELPVTLLVSLPADATLKFDGAPTQSVSSERSFVSPPLPLGMSYTYNLEATIIRDGQPRVQTRKVVVEGGKIVHVSFNFDATSVVSK